MLDKRLSESFDKKLREIKCKSASSILESVHSLNEEYDEDYIYTYEIDFCNGHYSEEFYELEDAVEKARQVTEETDNKNIKINRYTYDKEDFDENSIPVTTKTIWTLEKGYLEESLEESYDGDIEKDLQKYCDLLLQDYKENGGTNVTFIFKKGGKYYKIIHKEPHEYGESVHAFVDEDGNVYKPAGWRAPARGVRAKLEDIVSGKKKVDWAGGYLYSDRYMREGLKEELDENTKKEIDAELEDILKRNPEEYGFNVDTEEIKEYVKAALKRKGYQVSVSGNDLYKPMKYHVEYWKEEKIEESAEKDTDTIGKVIKDMNKLGMKPQKSKEELKNFLDKFKERRSQRK